MNESASLVTVDLITVNLNSATQTIEAVKPYLFFNDGELQVNVIVVDNASTDNSLELLKPLVPKLVVSKYNMGFAKACNLALEGSTADYILLVNPDTTSEISVLKTLINYLKIHPEVAITGPQQRTTGKRILHTCGRIPSFKSFLFEMTGLASLAPKLFKPGLIMRDWDHLTSRKVDHVMGSYMLIRRSAIVGKELFNNNFFLYLEDIDLSKRVAAKGYSIYFNAEVYIFHEGAATGNRSLYPRLYYFLSTRRKYWKKYMKKSQYRILLLLSVFVEPLLRLFLYVFGRQKLTFTELLKIYVRYFKELRSPQ